MAADTIISVSTISDLRQAVETWRASGATIALVPTMGGLHAGHLALVEEARRRCRRMVVSIFVNPTQFGAGEDFESYPRDMARDREELARLGVDLLYAPTAAEMYPDGFASEVRVAGLGEGLCAVQRPHHFPGVATVVAKLLNQCRPH
ncbi:MAG: pantoate--beta-alanine ligase, partial [SAR324 cluster bacterium]|nr:pantoate--beta-alanine ligase [SAR324 cluster bacterium]